MIRELKENLDTYFPSLYADSVEIKCFSPYELVVTTEAGEKYSYNDLDKTIRKLPADCNNLTLEEYCREFGIRLRSIMKSRGVKQGKLAEMIGMHQAQLCNYMNGVHQPSGYVIDKISKALDCSSDEFRYYYD